MSTATIIVICGVTGSGKTTVGKKLAQQLDWPFIEGDDYHSPANIEKMRNGIPLNDADRLPWLDTLAQRLSDAGAHRISSIASCSALKRRYRRRLRAAVPGMAFVQLSIDAGTLRKRVAARTGHFAGVNLIDSQLAALETLLPEEGIIVDAGGAVEDTVAAIRSTLPV